MEVLVEYEYVAVEEDELTIRPGDVITDVIKISDGWMEGNLDGKTGAFPDNFVKEIKKEEKVKSKEAPPPPRTSHKKQGSHVEELAKKIGTQGIKMGPPPSAARVVKRDQPRRLYRAKVTFSYTPENDDELRLEVGDVIDVMQKAEEGWLEGALNGKTGMFPSNFVEVCNEEGPTEEKPAAGEADKKGKKLIGGQGFGNIFNNGPITLRSTSDVKPELESKSSPAPRETEKTASLKRPPPALPPKDVTEGKKSSSAEALGPVSDLKQLSPELPNHRSSFSEPYLESIPENPPYLDDNCPFRIHESGLSHSLNSSDYSYDEHACLHADDGDHASLDSEGCAYISPPETPIEILELSCSPSPVSRSESEVQSPQIEMLKTKLNVPSLLDGRRSAASGASSGSDVPIETSAISQTRATPPPKLTFKKRRAMGTPKNQLQGYSPLTPASLPSKPPQKRPRQFLSASGIGWTKTTEAATGAPDKGGRNPALARSIRSSDLYFSVDGCVSSVAGATTLWGFNENGEFTLGPQMISHKVEKKVKFSPEHDPITPKGDCEGEEMIFYKREVDCSLGKGKKERGFKAIDPAQITDSIDLAKEKLKSGRWCKPESVSVIDPADSGVNTAETQGPHKRRSLRQKMRDTVSSALSVFLSSSPRRSYKLSQLQNTGDILDDKINTADEITTPLEEAIIPEKVTKEIPVDIVSATALPTTKILSEDGPFAAIAFREEYATNNGRMKDDKIPIAGVKRRKSLLRSPFSRWSKYKIQKKVSPIDVDENRCETPELIDGMTYKRMPDIEPSYLESLNELGKLSPSVRRLSQRYSLFQKGVMTTRSTEYLDMKSRSFEDNKGATSMPKLPLVHSGKGIPPKPYSLFLTQFEEGQEGGSADYGGAGLSSSDGNDIDKIKSKRSFSLRRSLGTWPRKFKMTKGGETAKKEEADFESDGETNENRTSKRKRWNLLNRSKSLRTNEEDKSKRVKHAHSFFGSIRKRFSLRRAPLVALDPERVKVSFSEPMEQGSQGRMVEYKDGMKRRSIMRLTVPSPPRAEGLEIFVDEQNPRMELEKNDQQPESTLSHLENMHDSKPVLKSANLWRIESSPGCGDKWIACNLPTPSANLPQKASVRMDHSLTECKSDGELPNLHTELDLKAETDIGRQSGDLMEEPIIKANASQSKSIHMNGVEKFFSHIDKGVDMEVEVTSRGQHHHYNEDDELEESLVIDSLNEIVDHETSDDLAKAIVNEIIHRAFVEVAEESGQKTSYLDKLVLNQFRRSINYWEEQYIQEKLKEKFGSTAPAVTTEDAGTSPHPKVTRELDSPDLSTTSEVTKTPYYRMMREGYHGLNSEIQDINSNNNENNSNSQLNQEVLQFFDLSYEEETGRQSLSPQCLGPTVRYDIEGFGTPSQWCRDDDENSSELRELVDAFFGKKPSPLSPEDKQDIQHKLDSYIKFQERQSSSSSSTDSPVWDWNWYTAGQAPASCAAGDNNCSFSNRVLLQPSFKHSEPAVKVQLEPTFTHCLSCMNEVEKEGPEIDGRCHLGVRRLRKSETTVDMKPAGSMFYGDKTKPEFRSTVSDSQLFPMRQQAEDKIAGSFFTMDERKNEEKTMVRRSVGFSLDERPVGIHLGVHQPIESRKRVCSPRLEDRPVGFHGQVCDVSSRFSPTLWSSPKPEDKPVGIHFGSTLDHQLEVTDALSYKLLQSPLAEDRPLGVHYGRVSDAEEVFMTPSTNIDGSFIDSEGCTLTTDLLGSQRPHTADTSIGALSYYSLDESINFSSSSIVDRLP